jgi:ribosomal protein S18 acetylase RimI-like enzyme
MTARADLRPANAGDLPLIWREEHRYMRDVEPESASSWIQGTDRQLALWIANLERTFIAERAGQVAGYFMWTERAGGATLITISVVPEHRRHGLGAELLQGFIDDARRHRVTRLDLGVHRANPAQRLYDRAGFVHTHDDADYLIYQLSLPDDHEVSGRNAGVS